MRVVPVTPSKARIFLPSLPIIRPFISSLGNFTIAAPLSLSGEELIRCMVSTRILLASNSISFSDFSRSSFLFAPSSSRHSRSTSLKRTCFASWLLIPVNRYNRIRNRRINFSVSCSFLESSSSLE